MYLHTGGRSPEEVGREIASAVQGEVARVRDEVLVRRPMYGNPHGLIVVGIERSIFYENPPDPAHPSLLDLYDISCDIRCTHEPESFQQAEALEFFNVVTSKLRYPVVLMRGVEWLVAAWSPVLGRTDFPPRTSPDEDDCALWQPYADPAAISEAAKHL